MTDKRTKRLLHLMKKHRLSAGDVGEMLGRTAQTVRVWRCAWGERAIPEHTLLALETKIAQRAAVEA